MQTPKKLTPSAKETLLFLAKQEAKHFHAEEIQSEHLALAILKKNPPIIHKIFAQHRIKLPSILTLFEELIDRPSPIFSHIPIVQEPTFSKEVHQMIQQATNEAQYFQSPTINEEHLFLAILSDKQSSLHQCVSKFGITCDEFRIALHQLSPQKSPKAPIFANTTLPKSDADFFAVCINLNDRIKTKHFHPIAEREQELLQMIQILKRTTKNNPLLIGPAGVGKTALVEALAHQINQEETPDFLHNTQIFELQVPSLLAGTRYRGDFEERINNIISTVEANPDILLFIDEIHLIAGAGSSSESALDIANILKPALARGTLRCIGATTHTEYQQYLQADAALERRFQRINVTEPSDEQMLHILQQVKQSYEKNHQVTYPFSILPHIINLSKIHLPNRFMPDKALDLMDEVGATKSLIQFRIKTQLQSTERNLHSLYDSLKNKPQSPVPSQENDDLLFHYNQLRQEYEHLYIQWQAQSTEFEAMTITINDLFITLSDKLKIHPHFFHASKNLFSDFILYRLKQQIVGHQTIIPKLVDLYTQAFRKQYQQDKPLLSLLLLGPQDVGRHSIMQKITALSHADAQAFLYIDMALCTTAHNVKELFNEHNDSFHRLSNHINIIQSLKDQPQLTLYLDNIEQAHPEFFPYLKGMLTQARITSSIGKSYALFNTVIVLASSLTCQKSHTSFHLHQEESSSLFTIDTRLSDQLGANLSQIVDQRFHFEALTHDDITKLFDLQWQHLQHLILKHAQVQLEYDPALPNQIIALCEGQPSYLLRIFEQKIQNPLLKAFVQINETCQKRLIIVHYQQQEQSITWQEKESDISYQKA
ncbi:AAA family ATPase [Entomospira culicis]|uniref:ATP-dependent Clp protease ATP-binding subunit n=1 Tax=Entomospira culicis TaxID=2719989 RepID=A0A968GJ41_9SPIO|nr:AAA family ATPase [Entomospira culicis]NIZ19480.1 ATP-dependent Clp protease ATP-binding subunit [Entomospira culicis]NIZ69615.1 ATP-dependent Clp protease ATP-binding subunit [Entomospira culicis]WDI36726.1 AAA family ATPase [Entomospira culicis]WDI38355.1 AAA family ATPase [Entomospira culicis]